MTRVKTFFDWLADFGDWLVHAFFGIWSPAPDAKVEMTWDPMTRSVFEERDFLLEQRKVLLEQRKELFARLHEAELRLTECYSRTSYPDLVRALRGERPLTMVDHDAWGNKRLRLWSKYREALGLGPADLRELASFNPAHRKLMPSRIAVVLMPPHSERHRDSLMERTPREYLQTCDMTIGVWTDPVLGAFATVGKKIYDGPVTVEVTNARQDI